MNRPLTQKDIKRIKSQCNVGFLRSLIVLLLGTFLTILYSYINSLSDLEESSFIFLIVLIISLIVLYGMNRKYFIDIRNGVKDIKRKKVQKKESKVDYEADSNNPNSDQNIRSNDGYIIVVDDTEYKVEKDVFDRCKEGEEVIFNYAPFSKYLINIEINY